MKKAKKLTKVNAYNDLTIWQVIISYFPYAMRIRLLALSKTMRDMIQRITDLPLLTSATITDAQRVMKSRRRSNWDNNHSGQYHFDRFLPSPHMDLVIARYEFEGNMVYFDTLKNVVNEPPKDIAFSVEDVLNFAACRGKLDVQYITFKERNERHRFITTYLNFSNTQKHPRWHLLKNQSEESLLRLIESLHKYKKENFREKAQQMIHEVELAIQDKKNKEMDMLGKQLGKLKL